MASIDRTDIIAPTLLDRAFAVFRQIVSAREETALETADAVRARRAFVQEMLDRNPNAFSSDLDVKSMMQHYPDSF
ncbi:hypothetical protein [Aestuariicoccus sp. MJ-SS9]|uniref:hypothetical protein n=1 Tax=Aestuariicoccus sp. MJ-SS9 TaxID=3079855 RepID=UPI0029110D87|nr:hypothetical protein [Aestuariicoccus sp. MJ-SS9]MDU8909709.1 hypothetical protein [Aestuariicoccus sp. MJ-SS9]